MENSIIDVGLNRTLTNTWDIILVGIVWVMVTIQWIWISRHERRVEDIALLFANAGMMVCLSLRIFYFVPGRMVAPDGEYQHELWLDWRWLVIGIITAACLYFADRLYVALGKRGNFLERITFYFIAGLGAYMLAQVRI